MQSSQGVSSKIEQNYIDKVDKLSRSHCKFKSKEKMTHLGTLKKRKFFIVGYKNAEI